MTTTTTIYFEVPNQYLGDVMIALAPVLQHASSFMAEGAKAKPTRKSNTSSAPSQPREAFDGVGSTLLEALQDGEEYSYETLGAALSAKGYSPSSVSPGLTSLVRANKVVRTRRGHAKLASV